ncbi:hypothetical protein F7O43_11775 [Neisseria meningitidis]|nr:hypothetical protein [Neisseria meningitidis]MBG8807302.1 hypothetical protein [Neisseria meningitidis]MBG8948944.1 hypothetical protein [Neisseria meningitidis]MBG9039537.1 hypothetical protein [Neisseria meningitidis]MBG9071606.1 hypothetical protein [Neisseria meningitidis]
MALPRFSSKRTILSGAEAPSESVPYYLYCLRLRRLVLIFVNPLYPISFRTDKTRFPLSWE